MTRYWAPLAWLDGAVHSGVRLAEHGGRWDSIELATSPDSDDVRLPGLALPGIANTHSHAFHRALRGRTHGDGGTFWTWRERMYALAERLEPDSYGRLARAVFAEMALSGVSAVGEFHYLHHRADGTGYAEPNAFGEALIEAATAAGIRITLLDTCYLAAGVEPEHPSGTGETGPYYLPAAGVQVRFSDGDAAGWRRRVELLAAAYRDADQVRIGAAIHSVRAVPDGQLRLVIDFAGDRPLHAHVSEQPAENAATLAAHGCTPTELLARHGFGGPGHTAVHATHLSEADIAWYGATATNVSFCPSTERDLADGIGPASALAAAGARLSLGSDQNAVVDLFEEARALELDDRLASRQRGRFQPSMLVDSLTATGQAGLGWTDAGRFELGGRADLVAVRLDSVRTAGGLPDQVIMAASAGDVHTVVVDGRRIVHDGRHILGDVGRLLAEAIEPLWSVS